MNRRSLVQSLLPISLFSWLAPQAAPKGLEARRKEAIRLFTLAFDNCVKAEQEFIPEGLPLGIDIKLLAQYPGRKIVSNPNLKWDGNSDTPRET